MVDISVDDLKVIKIEGKEYYGMVEIEDWGAQVSFAGPSEPGDYVKMHNEEDLENLVVRGDFSYRGLKEDEKVDLQDIINKLTIVKKKALAKLENKLLERDF